jgi:hypothetical protein
MDWLMMYNSQTRQLCVSVLRTECIWRTLSQGIRCLNSSHSMLDMEHWFTSCMHAERFDSTCSAQKHVWASSQQGIEVLVGQPLIAADPSHRQMALHQPGSSHVQILSLDSLLVRDNLSAPPSELFASSSEVKWLHLSFSKDGLRLAAVARSHCSILCVYTRQDALTPFDLLCSTDVQERGTPIEPQFCPANVNFISFAGTLHHFLYSTTCFRCNWSLKRIRMVLAVLASLKLDMQTTVM